MIEVKNLVKEFTGLTAVDDISFEVPKGQICGFLGPNGAGKSTTMKMVTGFLEPTKGTVVVGGKDVKGDSIAVRSQIGYLPESAPSYAEMTVHEFLAFVAEMRSLGRGIKDALSKVRELCFLEQVWEQPIETLSKGFRQRVGFAQALIHDPPVLILDEPTDGLDPNQKHQVRQIIKQMGENKTIVLSTHILEEVEAICQRCVIIASGKLVADNTPEELMQKSTLHNAVTIKFSESAAPYKQIFEGVNGVDRVEDLAEAGGVLRLFPSSGATIVQNVSQVVREKSIPVEQILVEQGRLDEVFRKVTQQSVT